MKGMKNQIKNRSKERWSKYDRMVKKKDRWNMIRKILRKC